MFDDIKECFVSKDNVKSFSSQTLESKITSEPRFNDFIRKIIEQKYELALEDDKSLDFAAFSSELKKKKNY